MSSEEYSLVLDLGTSSIKYGIIKNCTYILLWDAIPIDYLDNQINWELDIEKLFNKTIGVLSTTIKKIKSKGIEPKSILITSQANTFLAVDENHNVLTPCILWIDNRAFKESQLLNENFPFFSEWSGICKIMPTHYIAKLLWLRKHKPNIFFKSLYFPLINEYFALKLTGKYFSEYSNRGMSGILNIKNCTIHEDLIRFIGLRKNSQPNIFPSCEKGYRINQEYAKKIGLKENVLVLLTGNDQSSSAIGAGVDKPGKVSVTFGTTQTLYTLIEDFQNNINKPMTKGEVYGRSPFPEYFFHLKHEQNCGLLVKKVKEEYFNECTYNDLFHTYNKKFLKTIKEYENKKDSIDVNKLLKKPIDKEFRYEILEKIIDYIISFFLGNIKLFESVYPIEKIYISGGLSNSPIWIEIISKITDREIICSENRNSALLGSSYIYYNNQKNLLE